LLLSQNEHDKRRHSEPFRYQPGKRSHPQVPPEKEDGALKRTGSYKLFEIGRPERTSFGLIFKALSVIPHLTGAMWLQADYLNYHLL
jgi:hypothetical protein